MRVLEGCRQNSNRVELSVILMEIQAISHSENARGSMRVAGKKLTTLEHLELILLTQWTTKLQQLQTWPKAKVACPGIFP